MHHRSRTILSPPRLLLLTALAAVFLALSAPAHAQGCTQCRDNTAATPPGTQAAYRHAIVLLAATACGIFAGSVLLLKRLR
ncbi:MAG TPA: hypothetical protein VNW54_06250 [Granulicella sp.]|jgi:hypothetical protein|nr:hypothetical protein [Granulicella sp.]